VLGLSVVYEAHHFSLTAGDGADVEGIRGGIRLRRGRAGSRVVFEVEPVVAVLQAEDVRLDVVVVASRCRAEPGRVEVEVDQSALDVEEATKLGVVVSMLHFIHRGLCVVEDLTDLKVFDRSKFSLWTELSWAGGQTSEIDGQVRMSTPSRELSRERENA
jgi:hypothetical protein